MTETEDDPGIDPSNTPIFRGGTNMNARPIDYRIDRTTGMVKSTHGLSVNTNPEGLSRFGGAYQIRSLPQGLRIIQRTPGTHYEIVPARPMTPTEYQGLLNRITFH